MMTEQEWREACERAEVCSWCQGCNHPAFRDPFEFYHRKHGIKYPPIGDPTTVLAMAVAVFKYNGETHVHLTDLCHLWSRTNCHTDDVHADNFDDAIVAAARTLPKETL